MTVERLEDRVDVRFFLLRRIAFIRQLYGTASAPYVERKRKIEAEEDPFVPPYSEDPERTFLDEWLEADESLHVLAYSCVSMLAAALRLYLQTWVGQSGILVDESLRTMFKKSGWFAGYRAHFEQRFGIAFDAAPAQLEILEEIVLARNRIEHTSSITSNRAQYADADLKKLRPPFFVDEREADFVADTVEFEKSWAIEPTLHITDEQLLAAISEVERFAEWFDTEIETRRIAFGVR